MKLFENRPGTAMLLSFFVASCLFAYGTFAVRMTVVTLAALLLTAVVLQFPARLAHSGNQNRRRVLTLSLSAVVCAGLLSVFAHDFYAAGLENRVGCEDHVTDFAKSNNTTL